MVDFEENAHRENEESVRKDSAHNAEHDGERVFLELGELAVERNRERDGTRRHEIVEKVRTREVFFVRDFKNHQKDDDCRARGEQWREKEEFCFFIEQIREPKANKRNAQPERS